MKKMMMTMLLFGCIASPVQAQNKTVKTMMEQIVALQVYIGYAQKGYSVVKTGLDIIGNLKRGEFDLHTDYFNSLAHVNPEVQGYVSIGKTLLLQGQILELCDGARDFLQGNPYMRTDELDYLERVFAQLLEDCHTILEEMEAVATDNQLTMKDSERIQRIDGLYERMLDAYNFSQQFTGEAKLLVQSRKKEDVDAEMARRLQGL
ncbi:hypothetical protein AMR72_15435 [Flavobacterium psychrophilum]|nr:hypothetical protein AMR72_15435 [Flavobacterium psychrophilum]AOE53783.1 hypothetical protein ALW18_15425 [Flavobacterium psychrophilum]